MGIHRDEDWEELSPCVDARAPERDAPPRAELTEEAQLRAFLRELRAERNARLVRDALTTAAVGAALAFAVTFGVSATTGDADDAPRAERADTETVDAPKARSGPAATPTTVVDGALAVEDVDKAIASERSEIARCLAGASASDGPNAEPGTVTMAFLVGERGTVLGVADVGSTVSDRAKVRCVARRMRSLTLPAPREGRAIVRHTF